MNAGCQVCVEIPKNTRVPFKRIESALLLTAIIIKRLHANGPTEPLTFG